MNVEKGLETEHEKTSISSKFSHSDDSANLIKLLDSSETHVDPNEEEAKEARQ